MGKVLLATVIAISAVIGWPIIKDAAIDRVQSNASSILRANAGPFGDALAELNDMGVKIPGVKEAAHQKAADELDALPFDRQVEFVIKAFTIDVRDGGSSLVPDDAVETARAEHNRSLTTPNDPSGFYVPPPPASHGGEVKVIVAPQPAPQDIKSKYDAEIAANIPNQALALKPVHLDSRAECIVKHGAGNC